MKLIKEYIFDKIYQRDLGDIMQRYFAQDIQGKKVILSRDDEHHLLKVMRARKGQEIIVIHQKKIYKSLIIFLLPLEIEIVSEILENRELDNEITLFMSLIRRERFEWVLEKATELGVSKIIPVETRRTQFKVKDWEKRSKRWMRIMKEASEQSERNMVPELGEIIKIGQINQFATGKKIFGWARNTNIEFSKHNFKDENNISIFIGPEGGIDETELKLLEKYGFESVSLGKRILRAETAAITAVSWIVKEVEF